MRDPGGWFGCRHRVWKPQPLFPYSLFATPDPDSYPGRPLHRRSEIKRTNDEETWPPAKARFSDITIFQQRYLPLKFISQRYLSYSLRCFLQLLNEEKGVKQRAAPPDKKRQLKVYLIVPDLLI